jgi:uncharacterized membrane protein YqjE
MEDSFKIFEELKTSLVNYLNHKASLLKIELAEKISKLLSSLIAISLFAICMLFVLVFISIALSIYIGNKIGEIYVGFLIVSIIHLIFGICIWKMRVRWIQIPMMNFILKQLFDDSERSTYHS